MLLGSNCSAQSVVGIPKITQSDSTTFELTFNTDSAAIVTVHASVDTTYRNAFIYFGRSVGEENNVSIKMDGLRNNTQYIYRILIGTEHTPFSGSITTGPLKN